MTNCELLSIGTGHKYLMGSVPKPTVTVYTDSFFLRQYPNWKGTCKWLIWNTFPKQQLRSLHKWHSSREPRFQWSLAVISSLYSNINNTVNLYAHIGKIVYFLAILNLFFSVIKYRNVKKMYDLIDFCKICSFW